MKTYQLMKDDVLMHEAISALMNKLGPVETTRFLAMDRHKRIESVKRHMKWQNQIDQNIFLNKVFQDT